MTFYIGVDFHPYQQTLCWCDEETGETTGETRGFYGQCVELKKFEQLR